MPSVFLNSGDNFVAASTAEIFGGAGNEQVSIQAGVTGVTVDQNVERVDLPGNAADFAFQQAGNSLQVFSGTTLVATIPLQQNGTQVVFSDGSVSVELAAGAMSLGGTAVSPTAAAAVVPTTIDSAVTSATAPTTGGNTGGGNTGNPNAAFTADKTSVDEGGSVTYTVTGNAGDTFTYALNGSGASPAQPTDFTSATSGSVTIAAGASSAQFSVTTASQDGAEFAESFSVTLTSGTTTVGTLDATINDTNNNDTAAPVVAAPGASLNYNENQAADAVVGTVTATDNVAVTGYAITSTTGTAGDFAIDNSGVISITAQGIASAANDFEASPNSVTLGVTASDAVGNTSTATNVVLDVKDVDDVAPTLSAVTLAGSTVTLTFSETLASVIPATGDFTVTVKGVNSNVNVNQATVSGSTVQISLAVAPAAGETFQVSYTPGSVPLTDVAGNAVTAISPTDVVVDTVAPNITASQSFSYQEGANDDTADVVGQVATDDASVTTFVIESGNADGFFAIDGSGNITLTAAGLNTSGAANDFETTPNQFTLGVSATDGAGNKSTTTDISINITDNAADNLAAPIITNLTTGADPANGAVLGSNNDDTISGSVGTLTGTTLSSIDFINAGDHTAQGGDTLNIELGASYVGGATIQNVEILKLTATATATFNTNGVTSFTNVINNSSAATLTVTNLQKAVSTIDINNISGVNGAGVYTWAGSQLVGTETLNINIDSVGSTANTSDIVIGTGGATSFKEIAISSDGSNLNFIRLNSDVAQTTISSLDLNGTKALTLALDDNTGASNIAATATTINASDMTGALTLSGLGAATHTVTGGSGDDVILFGANFTVADTVTGGTAGTDTLGANGAALTLVTTALPASNVSNIDTIFIQDDVTAATTVNLSLFGADVQNIRIATQTGADVINIDDLLSGGTVRFDGDALAANTIDVKNATNAGTTDTITIDLQGAGAATPDSVVFTMNGVENLTFNTSNATVAKSVNVTDAALENVIVKGDQSLDMTTAGTVALGTAIKTVDATGLTGTAALTVALNTAATVGAKITGSANADTITGSAGNDDITGGAGNDTYIWTDALDDSNYTAGTDILNGFVTTKDSISLDKSAFALPGTASAGVVNYNEGSAASLTAATAYDVIILTGTSYASIAAAEDAVAGTSSSATAGFIIFHNSTTSTVQAYYDADIGADGADSLFTTAAINFADLDDAANTGNIAGLFAIGDFDIIA